MQKLKDFAKLLRNVIFLFSYYIFFYFSVTLLLTLTKAE